LRRNRNISGSKDERGVVILVVAIVLLFVVGAMAVLAIDIVTFYTARSEAQLAADSGALAGARMLANSGATSDPSLEAFAEPIAAAMASQVATQNKVGGRNLTGPEVAVAFPPTVGLTYNPQVQVQVTRSDLPTFFARIWGRNQVAVTATAIAEAYNPSGATMALGAGGRVAPVCVKPWLLPNMDPTGGAGQIFNASGAIVDNTIVGRDWDMDAKCRDCSGGIPTPPVPGKYYPGLIDLLDTQAFPVPTKSLPTCSTGFNSYQLAVAACVPQRILQPITCGVNADLKIDTNVYVPHTTDRDADTVEATKCLIHDNGAAGDSDSIDAVSLPSPPFRYHAGNANPIAAAIAQNVLVSDSLVTVPVFDSTAGVSQPVTVIGFLQLFLNRDGNPLTGTTIKATIVNMAGCGALATGQPVLGTGASAIPVRLVAPAP
jgi:hypothetical protein